MKVWRLRNKTTREYFEGGRGQTIFTRPAFARRSWEDSHRAYGKPKVKFADGDHGLELVEFDLVEADPNADLYIW